MKIIPKRPAQSIFYLKWTHFQLNLERDFNPSEQDLNMFIQSFINVLKNYTLADGSLKDVLEEVSGTY